MIACLDACVLYPTVLRELLVGVARTGAFTPVWSARILEEWARAAARRNPGDRVIAEGEIARLQADWPDAQQPDAPAADLWLPDPDDIHVLATARAAGASLIVTMNLRDFPARELSGLGISAIHPDAFLYDIWLGDPGAVAPVVQAVHGQAEALSGAQMPLRGLMKRAKLPRLGKALAGPGGRSSSSSP